MNVFRVLHRVVVTVACVGLLASCHTQEKIVYFQDIEDGSRVLVLNPPQLTIGPNDKLSIIVSSKDPQLAALFNLSQISYRATDGVNSSLGGSGSQYISQFTVDKNGDLVYPVLGTIHVGGMTRKEIAQHIKTLLVSKNLINDPVVTVEFTNLNVTVLGEVGNPGRYNITRDDMTILDVLSEAGDLTIYGKRDHVYVLREEDGFKHTYQLDLRAAEQVYASPAFYIRPNDVVYVEPNKTRTRQSTASGNSALTISTWISVASMITTIVALAVN